MRMHNKTRKLVKTSKFWHVRDRKVAGGNNYMVKALRVLRLGVKCSQIKFLCAFVPNHIFDCSVQAEPAIVTFVMSIKAH